MFRNLFYSFGFLVFISATWAMEGKTDDGDGWLGSLPVMVRRDARQFQEAVHFSDLPDNPYAAYFQGALIGKVFHRTADLDATINVALGRLVASREAKGARAYFKKSFDVRDPEATTRLPFANAQERQRNTWHQEFQDRFNTELTRLTQSSNAFALFIKGFMLYDHGVVNHKDDEKNNGEQYLQQAANLYCLPALNFLEWLYAKEGHTKLAAIVDKKKRHSMAAALKASSEEVIRYAVREDMFNTLLPPSPSCCGCQRKRGTAAELPVINPAEHFAESFLETFGTLNRTFYGEALAHLNKTAGSMRRAAYLTTQSRFWFATSIVTPFVTMGINAAQLWSGYQTMPAGTPQDAQDIISTLTRNALGSLVTSTITFSYGAWVLYKSSDIIKLNTDVLRDQCILTALYLTVNKGTGAIPKAGETEAEGAINYWFQETKGFRLFSKKQTLSQRILNRR